MSNIKIDTKDRQTIIADIAKGDKTLKAISEGYDVTPQTISAIKRDNGLAIEKLKATLIDKVSTKYVARMVKESERADYIVDNMALHELPSDKEERYLKRIDGNVGKAMQGLMVGDVTSHVTLNKNSVTTNIMPNVLRMFHGQGTDALLEADVATETQ